MSTNGTPRTNRYATTCKACGTTVAPGTGHITGKTAKGWEITHTDSDVCYAVTVKADNLEAIAEAAYEELVMALEAEAPFEIVEQLRQAYRTAAAFEDFAA